MSEAKNLVAWMEEVPDPRLEKMVTYPLVELLFAALIGVLCRMEEWADIVYFAEENIDWLRRFFPYSQGVACEKTFRTVFSRIDQKAFALAFTAWAGQWSRGGVIAIDGKTLRGTGESGKAKSALHVLNAFAHDSGMVLGQKPVDGKSNEITAMYGLSRGQNVGESMRPLLAPDQIMMEFASGRMLVLAQGAHPIVSKRVAYWHDASLTGLWDDPRPPAAPSPRASAARPPEPPQPPPAAPVPPNPAPPAGSPAQAKPRVSVTAATTMQQSPPASRPTAPPPSPAKAEMRDTNEPPARAVPRETRTIDPKATEEVRKQIARRAADAWLNPKPMPKKPATEKER